MRNKSKLLKRKIEIFSFLILPLPLIFFLIFVFVKSANADLETLYVNSVDIAGSSAASCNACGGSCTLSTMNTQNDAGYGCFEGDTGGGTWEEYKFHFVPSASQQSNVYDIDLNWRGGDDGSCGEVDGAEFNDYRFWKYGAGDWESDRGDPPFKDGGWSGPRLDHICDSKSTCTTFYQADPKKVTFRIGGSSGGLYQNQDGLELDLVNLLVYYDPTAPSVSWTSSGFGTYDTDGTASATLVVTDSGGSGLASADYCYVARKDNDGWVYDGWVGENGYVCTSTGGNNQKIQCAAYCEDKVGNNPGYVYTTNSWVDSENPSASSPTVDYPYFSPDASTGIKDSATISMSPTDTASGVDCYQMEVKDQAGTTHVRWSTTGSCGGDANYSTWSSNPTTWAWNGRNDSDAQVAEGTYKVYVRAQDKAGRFSSDTGSTDQQYCAGETITYGTSVSGDCTSTSSNNSVYRQINEQNVSTYEDEVAYTAVMNFGNNNSGSYVNTWADDGSKWDFREATGWSGICYPSCWIDVDFYYNTDVPEGTITQLQLYTNYDTEDDDFDLYWYNYDSSSWLDTNTEVPSGQTEAYFTYNLCSGAGNCNPYVSGSGDIKPGWFDEDQCAENEDFFKIDYQRVRVTYNQRKLDVAYQFNTTVAKNSITSVEVRTDAFSGNEPMSIYKWNYSSSSWVDTGYSTPSTEPTSQTVPICSGSACSDYYVYDSGTNRQVKIRYLDTIAKDATVNTLSIDYQVAFINYGANWVETVVDRTPPTTTDDWTDNWVNYSPVNITLTANDNLSGVEWTKYCVDTEDSCTPTDVYTTPIPVTCDAGSICTQYVRYQSRDNAGNSNTVQSKCVRQDRVKPVTTDNWTDVWVDYSPVNITLTVDRPGADTYYCVDEANSCTPTTLGTSVSVTCAADSVCTQYVRYYSSIMGNNEDTRSKRVRQDLQKPTGGSISYTDGYYTSTSVPITFNQGTDADGSGIYSWKIERKSATLSGGSCGAYGDWGNVATSPASSPWTDTGVVSGNCYQYQLVVEDIAGNTAPYIGASTAKIDTSAPSVSVTSITEVTNPAYQYVSGSNTIYYNTAVTGTFTVNATASDSQSGINKVTFPALTGFSATNGGDDTTSPYSWTYNWATTSTQNASVNATGYNNANLTATAGFNVYRDVTAPAGGSISYTDGEYSQEGGVPITLTNGTDSGSGVAVRIVQRRSATYSGGSCGSYGVWGDLATNPSSPWVDTGVALGNCYQYRYVERDNVSNEVIYTSASTAIVNRREMNFGSCGARSLEPTTGWSGSAVTTDPDFDDDYCGFTADELHWTWDSSDPSVDCNTGSTTSFKVCGQECGSVLGLEDSRGYGQLQRDFYLTSTVAGTCGGVGCCNGSNCYTFPGNYLTDATLYFDYKHDGDAFDNNASHVILYAYISPDNSTWYKFAGGQGGGTDDSGLADGANYIWAWDPSSGTQADKTQNDQSLNTVKDGASSVLLKDFLNEYNRTDFHFWVRFRVYVRLYGGSSNCDATNFWLDDVRITLKIEPDTPPSTPTPILWDDPGSGSCNIIPNWGDSTAGSGIADYKIQVCVNCQTGTPRDCGGACGTWVDQWVGSTTSQITLTGTANNRYHYRVKAKSKSGLESAWSAVSPAFCTCQP